MTAEPTMRTCQQDRCKWCGEWTERKRGGFNQRDNGGFRNELHVEIKQRRYEK